MALITSAASGNFNAGATWTGGVVPTVGDEARASNGHTVTITANATCDEVSNAGTGIFTLNDGVTLTANVTSKSTTTTRNCLQFTAASPAIGYIVGNVTGGTVSGGRAVANTSSGTIVITGNVDGGSSSTAYGCDNISTGAITVTGNVSGGSVGFAIGCNNTSTGAITITGNVTAGSASTADAVRNLSTGTITITGESTASTAAHAVLSTNASSVVRASGSFIYASNGLVPINAPKFILLTTPLTAKTRYALNGINTYVDMFTADNSLTQADPADVRAGTVYADGNLTGTLAVPAAASVAFGVPVDNTTGTAALTPASVWDYALSSITTSSTIGKLLKDNVDATISSRSTATTAGIADAVWDELLDDHTTNGSFGARIVRSLNSNNTLQLTGSHHAAADVHEFQNEVIADYAFAPSAVTLFTDAVRTELATELTAITELHLIHGLKNGSTLTVTPTSRSAGAVSQTISGDGTTTTTVSRD